VPLLVHQAAISIKAIDRLSNKISNEDAAETVNDEGEILRSFQDGEAL
jgi:hypothetical protein